MKSRKNKTNSILAVAVTLAVATVTHAQTYNVTTTASTGAGSLRQAILDANKTSSADTIKFAIGKLNDYLLWFLTVLEVTLLLRFILKLIGADPNNLFAGFLYALTDIILYPFLGIVKSPSIHPNQAFEFSTLIAMAVYFLIFYALRRFLRILISGPEEPVE